MGLSYDVPSGASDLESLLVQSCAIPSSYHQKQELDHQGLSVSSSARRDFEAPISASFFAISSSCSRNCSQLSLHKLLYLSLSVVFSHPTALHSRLSIDLAPLLTLRDPSRHRDHLRHRGARSSCGRRRRWLRPLFLRLSLFFSIAAAFVAGSSFFSLLRLAHQERPFVVA